MKKILLLIIPFFAFQLASAQYWNPGITGIYYNSNVGVGTNDPKAKLDVKTSAGGSGQNSALRLRAGNTGNYFGNNQLLLSYAGGLGYSHAIKSRHNAGANSLNAIDFYTWQLSDGINGTGSLHTMSLNGGKVGIGIPDPTATLDVHSGDANSITMNLKANMVEVNGGSLSRHQDIQFQASGTVGHAAIRHYANAWQNARSELAFLVNDNSGLKEVLRLNYEGNVGIGTNQPAAKLDIKQSAGGTGNHSGLRIRAGNTGNYSGNHQILLSYAGGSGYSHSIRTRHNGGATDLNAIDFYTWQPSDQISDAGSLHTMSLNGGKVGIGVINPNEKLEVNGTIRSKKVLVEASPWPDYVFESDYDLMSLKEVEGFIMSNKHLPDVPSAKVVEQDGLDLGSMDATLLKKVEELTLYLIEVNKKVEKLQEENILLKKALQQQN